MMGTGLGTGMGLGWGQDWGFFGGTQGHLFLGGGFGFPPTREKAETPTAQHLNPMEVLYGLDALLPPNGLLVADGGDFVGTAAYIVRPRQPLSWLDPGEEKPLRHRGHPWVTSMGDING